MAYSQTDLDNLQAILPNGTGEVRFSDGRMVKYWTPDEILKAIQYIKSEMAAASRGAPPPVAGFATFRRD